MVVGSRDTPLLAYVLCSDSIATRYEQVAPELTTLRKVRH